MSSVYVLFIAEKSVMFAELVYKQQREDSKVGDLTEVEA